MLFIVCLVSLPIGTLPAEAVTREEKVSTLTLEASDTSLSFDDRVEILKRAADRDRTGRTAYAIVRLYLGLKDPSRVRDAQLWIERALRREKENPNYRAANAEIKWRLGQRKGAYDEAMKVVRRDPNHVEALYWAGRYSEWLMRRYDETERLDETYDDRGNRHVRRFSLSKFGDEGREDAISYLTRALEVDPEHRPSRVLLGLVYFESFRADALVALFEEHLRRHPDDAKGHFILGLGYGAQEDLKRSYASYVRGLQLMTGREQRFMTSVFMLTDGRPDSTLPDYEAIRKFWTGRDPLYLTPVNERMMEHCSRVAYVNLRFEDPVLGLEGWQTDKGQAYIRYGRPRNRRVTPAEIDTAIDEPLWYQEYRRWRSEFYGDDLFKESERTELWDYGGFRIYFVNPNRDLWKFEIAWQGSTPLGFSTLTGLIPDAYDDPYSWVRYDADYQIGQFRDAAGQTRLEITYALPVERVDNQEVRTGIKRVDLNQGLYLFDARWDTVLTQLGHVEMMPWVQYDPASSFLFASERLNLDPGTYFMAAEAQDRKTKSVGAFRQHLEVRDFGGDSLQVSSLMLARRVVERTKAPFGRNRFLILPNPVAKCERDGQASFYFEVYNLTRNAFGSTQYEVTYQVQGLTDEDSEAQPEWSTAVTYTREGTTDWEPNFLRLDLADIMPGPRAFRVVVKDLQSGEEATAGTRFRISW
jgi:GWxTD domain-containing protein